jgi:hypothetical protein
MSTGQKVDTLLDGCVVCSDSQKQRTYRVYQDPDFIWWVLRQVAGVDQRCCCMGVLPPLQLVGAAPARARCGCRSWWFAAAAAAAGGVLCQLGAC